MDYLKEDPLAPARGIFIGCILSSLMWVGMILMFLWVLGNQPYERIAPCDTDIDCMQKNPHVEFSLESN